MRGAELNVSGVRYEFGAWRLEKIEAQDGKAVSTDFGLVM